MTYEETMNSILTQRQNMARAGLKPSHVAFGFDEWSSFRKDARSQDVAFDEPGRNATVMGLLVVFADSPQGAKVLSDGAQT